MTRFLSPLPSIVFTALGLAGLLTAACAPSTTGSTSSMTTATSLQKPVRVGSYFWPSSFWVDVAWKKGWFKEAGLNVERVDINKDYFKAFDDLVDKKLDTMAFALFDFILYDAKGSDLVGVVHTDTSFGADALVARSGVGTTRDLVGQQVGLPKNTYLEFMFDIIARRDGLDTTKIGVVNVKAEDAATELAKGKLAAVMTWEPIASAAASSAHGKKLLTTADLPGVCGDLCAFRREFVNARPDDVQRYVEVWARTSEYIAEHQDEALGIVAEVNKKPLAEVKQLASQDKLLSRRDNELAFSFASGLESLHGVWRQMNDFMLTKGLVKKRLDSTAFLDNSFLLRLK